MRHLSLHKVLILGVLVSGACAKKSDETGSTSAGAPATKLDPARQDATTAELSLADDAPVADASATQAAAKSALAGYWKSGCIVDPTSQVLFSATAGGVAIRLGLVGLYSFEPGRTYEIGLGSDIERIDFTLESTAESMPPASFSATTGSLTVDAIDAAGVSGTFDSLSGFTGGFTADFVNIDFLELPTNGTTGGSMSFSPTGAVGQYVVGGAFTGPSFKFEGSALVRELTIEGDELTITETAFSDATCEMPTRRDGRVYSFAVGEAVTVDSMPATKLDLTVKTVKRTLVSPALVAAANSVQACGMSDWAANVEKDVTGATACQAPAAGFTVRQLYGVDGSMLKLGKEKADGSLPDGYDDEYEYLK